MVHVNTHWLRGAIIEQPKIENKIDKIFLYRCFAIHLYAIAVYGHQPFCLHQPQIE